VYSSGGRTGIKGTEKGVQGVARWKGVIDEDSGGKIIFFTHRLIPNYFHFQVLCLIPCASHHVKVLAQSGMGLDFAEKVVQEVNISTTMAKSTSTKVALI
jgi:hypothetical protein